MGTYPYLPLGSTRHMWDSVGTLLGNTRLEKTRRFLDGRVLARNYSKRKITNSTRSHSKVEFRVMPGFTRVFLSTFRSSISYVHLKKCPKKYPKKIQKKNLKNPEKHPYLIC